MKRQVSHFKRALVMMAAVQAIISNAVFGVVERTAALSKLSPYKSRGHGEGLANNKHSGRHVAQDKRDSVKRRNVLRNRRAHA